MSYEDYVINGITPQWIESVDNDTFDQGYITLHCAAYTEDDVSYALEEIRQFREIASLNISNTRLLNGGIGVQASHDLVSATIEGEDYQVAVEYPKYKTDSNSKRLIQWTMKVYFVLEGSKGSRFYQPPLTQYENLEYYTGTDKTIPEDTADEMGWVQITEARPVKRVEITGSACFLPAYAEVNGERLYWHYSHEGEAGANKKTETLVWEFDTPVTVITINSSTHTAPWNGDANHGFWPQRIRVVYA